MTAKNTIFNFEIPGHSTRREWAVYIIVAKNSSKERHFYVGKVGDNREGCNPIISRIGNHLSYNSIHSQFRNRIEDTTLFDYKCFYAFFGVYDETAHSAGKDRINELERRLNKLVNEKLKDYPNWELKNIHKGTGYINKAEKNKRLLLVTASEEKTLRELAAAACDPIN